MKTNLMTPEVTPTKLLAAVMDELNNLKAVNISSLDVTQITPLIDYMVIATGNSSRHVRAISDNLIQKMKERHCQHDIEADEDDEWILVDLGDIVVHIMQAKTRDFYNLEKLWSIQAMPEATFATG